MTSRGTLFVVATPIGNLKDITLRALEVLKEVDIIAAEDTRVTKKLLNHYGVSAPVVSCHKHSGTEAYAKIAGFLEAGRNVALVTDAGTPGISDPGPRLIQYIVNCLSSVIVSPVPGPSAVTAVLSASGCNADRFTFLGYPPHKKGRRTFFETLKRVETRPIVLYESPHRLQKTLAEIDETLGSGAALVIAKELTKIHEEIWRGTAAEAKRYFLGAKGKGEFALLIS